MLRENENAFGGLKSLNSSGFGMAGQSAPPEPLRREIGFHTRPEDKGPAAKHRKIREQPLLVSGLRGNSIKNGRPV
jgi:hypothetical protein